MRTASELVEWARSQIGVTEEPPNSNMVKYWDTFPSLQGNPWCLCFGIYGLREIGFGKDLAPDIYSCTQLREWAKKKGLWASSGFIPGDVLLFDFDGNPGKLEHAGICIGIDGEELITIEGNTSVQNNANGGAVMERRRSVKLVNGAYRPPYEGAEKVEPEQTKTYTVKRGDSLWKIAQRILGNGARWREIYELNKSVIGGDPNRIMPGQVLMLPGEKE